MMMAGDGEIKEPPEAEFGNIWIPATPIQVHARKGLKGKQQQVYARKGLKMLGQTVSEKESCGWISSVSSSDKNVQDSGASEICHVGSELISETVVAETFDRHEDAGVCSSDVFRRLEFSENQDELGATKNFLDSTTTPQSSILKGKLQQVYVRKGLKMLGQPLSKKESCGWISSVSSSDKNVPDSGASEICHVGSELISETVVAETFYRREDAGVCSDDVFRCLEFSENKDELGATENFLDSTTTPQSFQEAEANWPSSQESTTTNTESHVTHDKGFEPFTPYASEKLPKSSILLEELKSKKRNRPRRSRYRPKIDLGVRTKKTGGKSNLGTKNIPKNPHVQRPNKRENEGNDENPCLKKQRRKYVRKAQFECGQQEHNKDQQMDVCLQPDAKNESFPLPPRKTRKVLLLGQLIEVTIKSRSAKKRFARQYYSKSHLNFQFGCHCIPSTLLGCYCTPSNPNYLPWFYKFPKKKRSKAIPKKEISGAIPSATEDLLTNHIGDNVGKLGEIYEQEVQEISSEIDLVGSQQESRIDINLMGSQHESSIDINSVGSQTRMGLLPLKNLMSHPSHQMRSSIGMRFLRPSNLILDPIYQQLTSNEMNSEGSYVGSRLVRIQDLLSNPPEKLVLPEEYWGRNSPVDDIGAGLPPQQPASRRKGPQKKANVIQLPIDKLVLELITPFSKIDITEKTIGDKSSALVVTQKPHITRKRIGDKSSALVLRQKPKPKSKPKAEVLLDSSTSKRWNLLLRLSDGSAVEEEKTDEEEEINWEETRKLFHGRVALFTAKMRGILGDRTFKIWKGSVVDSVVGVYLTQNVSDFLSSSAYMKLASKFPLQSTSTHEPYFVTEPEIPNPVETGLDLILAPKNPWFGLAPAIKLHKGNRGEKKDWESLRRKYSRPRNEHHADSVDWEAVRKAPEKDVADTIKLRGQHNILAKKIQAFLNREFEQTGTLDLEWLRYAPPDCAKEYLLDIQGIGLKSVECLRLLTLHHVAFPVDTNVARIAVRLGWVPLKPLPGELQLHLLDEYPLMDQIQQYLWPRLCMLDHRALYELHYLMITFGKVFCTKKYPNCGACPMRAECKHLASEIASQNHSLPCPPKKGGDKKKETSVVPWIPDGNLGSTGLLLDRMPVTILEFNTRLQNQFSTTNCFSTIEEPKSPQMDKYIIGDIEDFPYNCSPIIEVPKSPQEGNEEEDDVIGDNKDFPCDGEGILDIKLNEEFKESARMDMHLSQAGSSSRHIVTGHCNAIPSRKLKCSIHLRTEHLAYELPDGHIYLKKLPRREHDDPSPYLLAIWSPGETPDAYTSPVQKCNSQGLDSKPCDDKTCLTCQSRLEAEDDTVRGTLLIPIKTANKGRFPLNGTYFQVNEVFADHETSLNPLIIRRSEIYYCKRRTVYFGTSPHSIFRTDCTEEDIRENFYNGFICVRSWNSITGKPGDLAKRFHCPPSKMEKTKRGPNKKSAASVPSGQRKAFQNAASSFLNY